MNPTNLHRTPLVDIYPDDPAMMEFGGWKMPRDFGSIVQEHLSVRQDCGVFDLSHMGRLVLNGVDAIGEIDRLFTRSCRGASDGRALYGFFCDENGGCVDDAILYRKSDTEVWMVVNAANRKRVINWIKEHTSVPLEDRTFETVLLAIQGPEAPEVVDELDLPTLPESPFRTRWWDDSMLATTGYTGEAGGELWLNREDGRNLFRSLAENDLPMCGLGARDTLRLEKAFPLHGHELSETLDPVTAGFERFIDWEDEFVGRDALDELRREGPDKKLIGLTTGNRRSPREDYPLRSGNDDIVGRVTSGGYSPILEAGIGLAQIQSEVSEEQPLRMKIRDNWQAVERVPLPFV